MKTIYIAFAVSIGIAILAAIVLWIFTVNSADVFSGDAVRLGALAKQITTTAIG